jgi:predicted nucleotidyltransferase
LSRVPQERLRDLRSLHKILPVLCEELRGVVAAWHYGSSVRQDFDVERSDVDILIAVSDDAPTVTLHAIAKAVHEHVVEADVTVLRVSEIIAGIHPGWSKHFYVNVARSGIHLFGPNLLEQLATPTLAEAEVRLTQLCQRARLVVLNHGKEKEASFWLAKYQHWVPLCLMELLDLHGTPCDELHSAHDFFTQTFQIDHPLRVPYTDFNLVHDFLELVVAWVARNRAMFSTSQPSCGLPPYPGGGS